MTPDLDIKPGAIMQLDPHKAANPMFGACLFVVTAVRQWGAQGYVQSLGEDAKRGGQAHYRAAWDEMEPTGGAVIWSIK